MSGLDNFVNAATGGGPAEKTFYGAQVTGVNGDGTVDLRYLGGDHAGIDCLASYTNRTSGDVVVVRSDGIHWLVIGKLGAEVNSIPNISWGNGSPVGSDWASSTAVKVRPGQIYIQGSGMAADNTYVTPQAIIPASFDRAFQGNLWNHAFSGRPAQGQEVVTGLFGSGVWSGGWYYSTDLTNAVQAKTVKRMELRIERGAEPWGLDEPVIPWIYAHDDNAQGTSLSFVAGPYAGTPLAIGQSAWWQVPDAIITMLNASTAAGFGIASSLPEEFMVMAELAGDVRIYN
jgi:hypothetical protein